MPGVTGAGSRRKGRARRVGQEKGLETAACSPHFPKPKPGQQSRTDERAKRPFCGPEEERPAGGADQGQTAAPAVVHPGGSGRRPGLGRVVGNEKTASRCYDARGAGADRNEEKGFFFFTPMSSRSASRCRSLNPICFGSVWSHCSLGQV